MTWICKRYEQTTRVQPKVIDTEQFTSFEEAEHFYKRMKRAGNWPWEFWSYPEEIKEG